jgi:hypothetical protein
MIVIYRVEIPFSITNGRKNMKEIITMVKGYVDDLAHLMMSFVAIGAVSEVIFGTGVFGVNVIGNLTSIINTFGESGFAGLVALLVLVGLFRK